MIAANSEKVRQMTNRLATLTAMAGDWERRKPGSKQAQKYAAMRDEAKAALDAETKEDA